MPRRSSRKQDILECLAKMLEDQPGERITTAKLAEAVGVSEAALYRHYPSKAKMFESLIVYIEDSLFSRITQITQENSGCQEQCQKICTLVLLFAEKNPGLSRILTGEALSGDISKLRSRMEQLFDRLNTQLKQLVREAEIKEGFKPQVPVQAMAGLLTAVLEGRIVQYVRTDFRIKPSSDWNDQWQALAISLFAPKVSAFKK
jgi:TetR/AcrR family transcriptional regulator